MIYYKNSLIKKYKQLYYQDLNKTLNILKYPYKKWNMNYLIENKIIDFIILTKFKYITQDIINEYPNKPWDWEWLIENTNIKLEKYVPFNLIEKYKYKWNYKDLSENLNLTEEFILKYSYKKWNINYLIKNNKITNFNTLTKFKNINHYDINKYLDKPWDWEWLIENINIRVEKYIPLNLIEKYSYKWDYWELSFNLNLIEEFILKYPYKLWNIDYLIENNKITDFNTLSKFKNINEYIINRYPNKPWDWEWLIENTNIILIPNNLIEKYENRQDYYKLSRNQNITQEFILKYPNKNWDIEYLIENNKITNFKALTKFKYIYSYIINKYSYKTWDWEWLIENTDINIEYHIPFNLIEKYPYKWDYQYLSYNPNLTEDFILKYSYQNWDIDYLIKNNKITDFNALSKFKSICKYIIDKYPTKSWDCEWLIENTDINIEYHIPFNLIEKYPYKWFYFYLSINPNLTEEFILKYPYQYWNIDYLIKNNKITDFNALSKFRNIDEYIIDNYPNKPWNWEWLIKNTDINIEKYIPLNLIEKYRYKKWNYWKLSKNPNLTEEFILKYSNQNWNIKYLIKKFIFKKIFYKFEIY